MFELVLYLIHTSAIATIVVLYYAYLLPFRLSRKVSLILPIVTMVALSSAISGFSNQNLILNFFLNFLLLLLVLCFFKGTIREILYALTLEVLILLSDGFSYYIFCLIWGEAVVRKDLLISSIGQMFDILLLVITAYLIAKKFKSIHKFDIPRSYWILLLIIPEVSIFLIYTIYGLYQNANVMLMETLVSVLLSYVMIVGSTIIYGNIVDYFNVKLGNQVLSSRIEAFSEKQNALADLSRETRRVQHDLKNRLLPIMYALEDGDYESAQNSLSQVVGDIRTVQETAYTGIDYVDDMLNYKEGTAKKYGISFHVNNEMEAFPQIAFMDISAAIGIALDNAIEACQKETARKDIFINFDYRMGVFYVRIENDLVGELRKNENGDILTTKPDAENHGLGIESIRNILKKYDGDMKIETKDSKFIINMICKASG